MRRYNTVSHFVDEFKRKFHKDLSESPRWGENQG
jgi:hypothetical protein